MPTYEYACNKCKAVYDLRQGFDAESTHACDVCGKGMAKRVLQAPSVVFKGSGWYVTDSRSKSSAATDSKLTETVAGGESSSSDSTAAGASETTKPAETKTTESKPAEPKSQKKSESSAAS